MMLWAWERPEDMRDIADSANIGVAFLAGTLHLSQDNLIIHRRHQPLVCSPHAYMMPVVRIEADRRNPPNFSDIQVNSVVACILQIAAAPNLRGLQVDFDATRDQRVPYKTILTGLRKSLPPEMPLSITAIASWCAGDYWLQDLPVDEVVPMYFDMGVSESAKWQYYRTISDGARAIGQSNCKCQSALGLSTSEPVPLRNSQYRGKRVYIFSSHPWQMLSNQKRNEITKILKYTEAS